MINIDDLKFNDSGLIPAIIQDFNSKEVLMLGYMNKESLNMTLETGRTWFFSRSRQKLWNKGETSGNYQQLISIKYDCDKDSLLIKVMPKGPTCHTENSSCFYRLLYEKEVINNNSKDEILNLLYERISNRKNNAKEKSYTKYLFNEGIDKILKKIGEESSEVIIASKNDDKKEMIYEISDLVYHLMVLLVEKNIYLDNIKEELCNRYRS